MQRTGIYVSCKEHRIGWLFIATFHQYALIHDKYTGYEYIRPNNDNLYYSAVFAYIIFVSTKLISFSSNP